MTWLWSAAPGIGAVADRAIRLIERRPVHRIDEPDGLRAELSGFGGPSGNWAVATPNKSRRLSQQ